MASAPAAAIVEIPADEPKRETTLGRYHARNSSGRNNAAAPRELGSAFLPDEERSLADGIGRPRRIWMACEFQQIFEVDIKSESFAFEILVKQVWRCPNLEAEEAFAAVGDALNIGARGVGLDSSWEPNWVPRIKVWRLSEELVAMQSHYIATRMDDDDDDVWITRWTTLTCRVYKSFNLRAFPFDSQFLPVRIEVDNVEEVRPLVDSVRRHAVRCIKTGVAALPAFVLRPDDEAHDSAGAVYKFYRNELVVSFLYQRVWEYHAFNEYLMLGLIASCAMSIWVVPFDSDTVGDRLALDITLLLVAVAFKQSTMDRLPPVSYLTLLDWYSLAAIVFVLLALFFHAVVGELVASSHVSNEIANAVDTTLFWTWVSTWCGWLGLTALYLRYQLVYTTKRFRLTKLRELGFSPALVTDVDVGDLRAGDQPVHFGEHLQDPRSLFGTTRVPEARAPFDGFLRWVLRWVAGRQRAAPPLPEGAPAGDGYLTLDEASSRFSA